MTYAVLGVFFTTRLSVQETLQNFQFFMNEGTTRSSMTPVDKVVYGEKSLVPDCNTLAYRKGN